MVMRNTPVSDVLRRRMFMTGPQFDRNDPVGIMGSSPELMQAVMRNRPQLAPMETGNPFIEQGLVRRLKTHLYLMNLTHRAARVGRYCLHQ